MPLLLYIACPPLPPVTHLLTRRGGSVLAEEDGITLFIVPAAYRPHLLVFRGQNRWRGENNVNLDTQTTSHYAVHGD